MFIMGKVPQYPGDRERQESDSEGEVLLQNMLLRSLLKVRRHAARSTHQLGGEEGRGIRQNVFFTRSTLY